MLAEEEALRGALESHVREGRGTLMRCPATTTWKPGLGVPWRLKPGGGRGVERRASLFPATGCEDTGEVGPGDRICLTLMTGLEHIK